MYGSRRLSHHKTPDHAAGRRCHTGFVAASHFGCVAGFDVADHSGEKESDKNSGDKGGH